MTGLVYLDVAIGVIFLVLIFSLFAGAILEAISGIFNLRARVVFHGLRRMLGNEAFDGFWKHPLIEGLKGPNNRFTGWLDGASETGKRNPSEIEPKLFAKAVLAHLRNRADARAEDLPDVIRKVRSKALDTAQNELEVRVAAVLEGVKEDAENLAEQVETALIAWYDATRDRFAGWYVRRTQWILCLIGLIMAVGTNTDPIRYGQELRTNDALRAQVIVMADEMAALEDLEDVRTTLGLSDGTKNNETLKQIREDVENRIAELTERLDTLGATAGWQHCDKDGYWATCVWDTANPMSEVYPDIPNPIFGWVLMTLGVMLGSQFWLDLLRTFMSVRSAATGILGHARPGKSKTDTDGNSDT